MSNHDSYSHHINSPASAMERWEREREGLAEPPEADELDQVAEVVPLRPGDGPLEVDELLEVQAEEPQPDIEYYTDVFGEFVPMPDPVQDLEHSRVAAREEIARAREIARALIAVRDERIAQQQTARMPKDGMAKNPPSAEWPLMDHMPPIQVDHAWKAARASAESQIADYAWQRFMEDHDLDKTVWRK